MDVRFRGGSFYNGMDDIKEMTDLLNDTFNTFLIGLIFIHKSFYTGFKINRF